MKKGLAALIVGIVLIIGAGVWLIGRPIDLAALLDFLKQNKDGITTLVAILVFVGGLIVGGWGLFRWNIRRKLRDEIATLDVITDPKKLLPRLYGEENDDSPLADHNILYVQRDAKRDVQAEMRDKLHAKRYLLIHGRQGMGKSREAGTLALKLMTEGWRVVRVRSGWLDVPREFPKELGEQRYRILIMLDDLNGLFRLGGQAQSPKIDETMTLGQPSYHDRLLTVLDYFEKACSENEIRVIATARDEADEWRTLGYDERDRLWKRFERYVLTEPKESVVVELLEEETVRAGIKAKREDFKAIARENDGTLKNVVLNLQRLQTENWGLTHENYTPTLSGSWKNVYDRACEQEPAVRYVYDAIDVLRQMQTDLYPFLVEPTARIIWGGNLIQRTWRRWPVHRAVRLLVEQEKVLGVVDGELAPHDGQIEAKPGKAGWKKYAKGIEELATREAKRKPAAMTGSLLGLGSVLYAAKEYEESARVWRVGTTWSTKEARPWFWSDLGVALAELKQAAEAEAAYREAIRLKADYAMAYNNLGALLAKDASRGAEAEAAYREAIRLQPDYATAYYNLGWLLAKDASRGAEAEAAYREAIRLKADDPSNYIGVVLLLRMQAREREAIPLLEKRAALDPQNLNPFLALASVHKKLGHQAESIEYAEKARRLIKPDDWYNLACLESVCGDVEKAFEYLRRALEQEETDRALAWKDPDFEWIRGDPRFEEIVGSSG
ncbi:MAG: tetratricopeptide repeat protein [Anaerolineae bacterium]